MVATFAAAGRFGAGRVDATSYGRPTDHYSEGSYGGITLPKRGSQPVEDIDYENAKPMPLPESTVAPSSLSDALLDAQPLGKPGAVAGRAGDGQEYPVVLVPPQKLGDIQMDLDGTAPQEFGTSDYPLRLISERPAATRRGDGARWMV